MIIALDHLTFNTNSLTKKLNYLKKQDYKVFFKQNVKNDKAKLNFLKQKSKRHKTIFLKKKDFNAIELTKYKYNQNPVRNLILNNKILTCYVKNLNKEKKFLKNVLNLRITKNFAHLKTFSKELSLQIKLKKVKKNFISHLDDLGFVCICLISDDIEKIVKSSKKHNIFISKKFSIKINKRNLKICLIKSPNNLIYEIIEFKK